jgi:hypothetical protein
MLSLFARKGSSMSLWGRKTFLILFTLATLLIAPLSVRAEVPPPRLIEAEVVVTASRVTPPKAAHGLMIQATSWRGVPYRYTLTLGNFSPWPLASLRVLDRYVPEAVELKEIDHEWLVEKLAPGQVASYNISFPEGALAGACHQIEINLGQQFATILMDCSDPGATAVWSVPLTETMAAPSSTLTQTVWTQTQTLPAPRGPSKMGMHATRNNSPNVLDYVRQVRPAVIVALEDFGWLTEAKAISPQTITVGRWIEGDQNISGDPVARARAFVHTNAARYLINTSVDYWLGWNEPVIDSVAQIEWYAAFEAERVAEMTKLGLKTAVGNFSAGTPEADEFAAFLPALVAAKKAGAILAVHEYSAPTLQSGVGAGIPGLAPDDQAGALTLRYRYWYNHYLRAQDLALPLVITEAGVDGGVSPATRHGGDGWRDVLRRDNPHHTSEALFQDYASQLSWYDDELRRDPYVIGFAIFNVGDADGRWKSFDITAVLPQLAELAKSKGQ